eukprot:gene11393-17524_t
MKKLDPEDLYSEGELVRLVNMNMLMTQHTGELVAVQEYLNQKDAWVVCLQSGDRTELYSKHLKKVDRPNLFPSGSVMRISAGENEGDIVTIQRYDPTKDAWFAIRQDGSTREVHSENLVRVIPEAFTEGQLVQLEGETVAVQQYLLEKDMWRVITTSGSHRDVYAENLARFGHQEATSPAAASSGKKISSTLKSIFSKFGSSTGAEAPRYTGDFSAGQTAHLKDVFMRTDGTMVLLQKFNEKSGKTGKWKVVLNTGDSIEVSTDHLRPTIDVAKYPEGKLAVLKKDGAVCAIQRVDEGRGMVCLRLNSGKPLWCFPDQFDDYNPVGGASKEQQKAHLDTLKHGPSGTAQEDAIQAVAPPAFPSANDSAPTSSPGIGPDPDLLSELKRKLREAGTSYEEARAFSEKDIDELLRDELKIPVVKRNKMKALLRPDPPEDPLFAL